MNAASTTFVTETNNKVQDTQVLFIGFFEAVTQDLITCSTSLSQLATLQTLLYVFTFLPLNVFFTYLAGFFSTLFNLKHVSSNKKKPTATHA